MASVNVTIPDSMHDWLQARIDRGGYQDAGEYLRELIRRDQDQCGDHDALVAALEKGEASGTSSRRAPEIVAALKRELRGDAA